MARFVARMGFIAASLISTSDSVSAQTVSVTVSPATASLKPNTTQQFTAAVTGATDPSVFWLVNGVRGGAPSIGLVNSSGLYTAPATLSSAMAFEIEAESAAAPRSAGSATASVAASANTGPISYVATNGNDSNPGTAGAPWRTIQHAVGTVRAGATILVRAGTYHELVTLTRSGSAAAGFISLQAFPGEAPVVDGTSFGIPGGQLGLFTISNASWLRIEGFEVRNYKSTSAAVPVGIYVLGSGSHIELRHNHIHDISTDEVSANRNALGIAVYGTKPMAISQLIIDGNEIDHLKTGFSESLSLSGNVVAWQVTRNLIHDNDNIGVNIEGFFHTAPQGYDQARNGLVSANTIYNISSKTNGSYHGSLGADGIYVDGGTAVTIQQNTVHDADIGIELASEVRDRATTSVIVHNNLVYHSVVTGISIGGAAPNNGGTTNCTITNNTLFRNDTARSGSGEFQIQFNARANVFDNNIVYAGTQGLLVNSFTRAAQAPANLNRNLYFSDAGEARSRWVWLATSYRTLAAFQTGSGQDPRSIFGDPQFMNPTTPDLRVALASPAINFGIDLGLLRAGLFDVAGNPRTRGATIDAGAYEH